MARSQEPACFSLVEDDFSEWEVTNGTISDKNRAEQQHRGAAMDDIWDFLGYITEE